MPRAKKGGGRRKAAGGIVMQAATFVLTAVRFLAKLSPETRELIFDQIESALRGLDQAKAAKVVKKVRRAVQPSAPVEAPAPKAGGKKKAAKKRPSRRRQPDALVGEVAPEDEAGQG